MSYARGKYGVEYTRRPSNEKSGGRRWMLLFLGALLIVSYILAHLLSRPKPTRIDGETQPAAIPVPRVPAPAPAPCTVTTAKPKSNKSPPTTMRTRGKDWMLENINQRPTAERVLLEKLAAAERQGEIVVAIDTIRRLCVSSAVKDLHPRLFTRLSQLNMQLLFSERSSPWTARVIVKKGDSRDLLARNSHSTGAVLDRLNPNTNWARIRPDDVVRVLQYVKAVLVVHKGAGFADLMFKGSFFRRFVFRGHVRMPAGDYPVSRESGKTAHAILRDLGAEFSPEDRTDLEMFLAPESTITVSDE